MSIGSLLFGKSFGNVFVWSKCVNAIILLYGVFDKMSIIEFLMKYNFMEFLMKCNYYGVSDKIIATMNKMMKAIKELLMKEIIATIVRIIEAIMELVMK